MNPVGTTSTSVTTQTTTGSMANNGTLLTIPGTGGVTFPTTPDPNVVITVSVAGAGQPASRPLDSEVVSVGSPTTATLADRARRNVTNVAVTITTTTTTYNGLVPLGPNGRPFDHIQFRWVDYSTSSYSGGSANTCAFTNRLCVGVTSLWR